MKLLVILTLCAAAAVLTAGRREIRCRTVFRGCRWETGHCKCGEAKQCNNPFPYESKHECILDAQGQGDRCKKDPCMRGQCVQAKTNGHRSWQCQCAGSGYYGIRCENKCPPGKKQNPLPKDYPVACIY
ncbi:hypothetical protein LSAT2_029862 [Lamellibrachia satsuma]|nr:hypothetical protein LSAT2_029862 [Lamellibrachia satsuma]